MLCFWAKRVWVLGISSCLLWACGKVSTPQAENGNFVLPQNLSTLSLQGKWEFYPSELILPGEFSGKNPHFVQVPAVWSSYRKSDQPLTPNYNCCTFRLKVALNGHREDLALIVPKIWTANRVYANGQFLIETGKVGCSAQENQNNIVEQIVPLPKLQTDSLELVVHVANFDFFLGGIIEEFYIGTQKAVHHKWHFNNAGALMWMGCLFLMSIYHYILFLGQRQNISLFYFSLLSLLICIRSVIFGDHFIYSYLKEENLLSAGLQPKIYYSITFLLAPIGLSYILSLYPQKHDKNIRNFSYIFAVLSLIPLWFSHVLFFKLVFLLQFIVILTAIYIVFIIFKSAYLRLSESGYQLLGIGAMIAAGANDALHSQGIDLIGENEIVPLAFGVFVGLQILVLATRFSKTFRAVIDLSANLEQKVALRTQQLEESKNQIQLKSDQLEAAYQGITDSLRYAKRIQSALLGQEEGVIKGFSDGFVFFEPKDIVSGDFYWHAEVNGYKIVAVSDCTGHGVPGAFMTVIGNDALDEIVKLRQIVDPATILKELDKRVLEILHQKNADEQRNEGMDIAVVVVDFHQQILQYSGAKNPVFFISDSKLTILPASKFPIGSNQFLTEKVFTTHTLHLKPYDKIYLFTDGFQDQFGSPENRKYMSKRFREFIYAHSHLTMSEQKDKLMREFREWKGERKQTDDVLIVGLTF
jgi:serine phosphatase RsbU (regulator of sigma subunit)